MTRLAPAADAAVHVLARPSPFRNDVARLIAPPGLSIAELAEQALPDPIARNLAQATLVGPDGSAWSVPRERWPVVRPRPGIELRLVVVPRGGSFRGIVRIALTIAIVVAAAALTAAGGPLGGISLFGIAGLGSTLIGAGITIAGSLLVNALIPVETPRLADLNGTGSGEIAKTSPTLTGSSNAARPWQPVPRAYGRHRVTPPKAARDVSETVTLQGGTAALSAKIIDKNPILGPLVQCFDAGGTGVAATVDALITGY